MSTSTIEITEKLLDDAGGWQAMKQARSLVEAGRVTSASYAPPLLRGIVRDGNTEYRAGLKITTRTNIENLCSCRAAREWGTVCAHSLAVGLAVIRPPGAQRTEHAPVTSSESVTTGATATKSGPFFSATEGSERIVLHIILSPNFQSAWEKD